MGVKRTEVCVVSTPTTPKAFTVVPKGAVKGHTPRQQARKTRAPRTKPPPADSVASVSRALWGLLALIQLWSCSWGFPWLCSIWPLDCYLPRPTLLFASCPLTRCLARNPLLYPPPLDRLTQALECIRFASDFAPPRMDATDGCICAVYSLTPTLATTRPCRRGGCRKHKCWSHRRRLPLEARQSGDGYGLQAELAAFFYTPSTNPC